MSEELNIIKKEGFNYGFDASACEACGGNCCIGESGYIWINKAEIEKLASILNLSVKEVAIQYLRKVGYKYSIQEKKITQNNYACAFFDLEKRCCSVYEARPIQCRTFPFWDYFKNNEQEVYHECPAITKL